MAIYCLSPERRRRQCVLRAASCPANSKLVTRRQSHSSSLCLATAHARRTRPPRLLPHHPKHEANSRVVFVALLFPEARLGTRKAPASRAHEAEKQQHLLAWSQAQSRSAHRQLSCLPAVKPEIVCPKGVCVDNVNAQHRLRVGWRHNLL